MAWKSESERHSDAMVEAIHHAAHQISEALTKGFQHMADVEAQAIADLQTAVVAVGDAIATEIQALQAAMNNQGVNHTPEIVASTTRLNQLVSDLKTSVTPPAAPPADTPPPAV